MKRVVGIIGALVLSTITTLPAVAQETSGDDVVIEPSDVSIQLGERVDVQVTVTNRTQAAAPPITVHIDITSPSKSTSVDPEDWTSTLSRKSDSLPAGAAQTLNWSLRPIAGGEFVVYAVAPTPDTKQIQVSDAMSFRVSSRRTLNPESVLPVAIAAPVLVGALLGLQLHAGRKARKRGQLPLRPTADGTGPV